MTVRNAVWEIQHPGLLFGTLLASVIHFCYRSALTTLSYAFVWNLVLDKACSL